MVTERFYNCATVECKRNIREFMGIGEGRELTRLENTHISKLDSGMKAWMG
jgi:hypothetical protein